MIPPASGPLLYQRARFAARLPRHFLYTPAHYWIETQPDNTLRVGLTSFATRMLGELVDFGFDAPAGGTVALGQTLGWLEGFKAVSDVFSVAEGRFLGPNPALENDITLIHREPFGSGWIYAVEGAPDASVVSAEGYALILDETIDRLAPKPRSSC